MPHFRRSGPVFQQTLKKLNEKLKPITDAEAYAKTTRKLADSDLPKARLEAKAILDGVSTRKQELEQTIEQLQAQSRQAEAKLMMVNEGLKLRSDEAFLLEVGYYEPVYGFEGWRPRQWCKSPGPQPGVAGLSVRTSGDRLHG